MKNENDEVAWYGIKYIYRLKRNSLFDRQQDTFIKKGSTSYDASLFYSLRHPYLRPFGFHRPSNLLVAKLTSVPSAAVSTVCRTSPSEILAQMEQIVPPIAEMRISFSFIGPAPFHRIHIFGTVRDFRRRLILIQYCLEYSQSNSHIL